MRQSRSDGKITLPACCRAPGKLTGTAQRILSEVLYS
jgi:hypothetical protein